MKIISIDAIMDAEFGKPETTKRKEFRKEVHIYYIRPIVCDARKKKQITQSELAEKIETKKSYIQN